MSESVTKGASQEFLAEAWEAAKRKLPGWAYHALLSEARARAGGKASGLARRARAAAMALKVYKAEHSGVIVAMRVPEEVAQQLALPGGEPVENLHVTLCYLGDRDAWSADELGILVRTVSETARATPPLGGRVSGVGAFANGDLRVHHATVDMPGLAEFRARLVRALDAAGISQDDEHGFDPHITLRYAGQGDELPEAKTSALTLSTVCVYVGDEVAEVELTGQPMTAPSLSPAESMREEAARITLQKLVEKAEVPAIGPEGGLLFVGSSAFTNDKLRGEPFSGTIGETLNRVYLEPLGLARNAVALACAIPTVCKGESDAEIDKWRPWLMGEIERLKPRAVIALGRTAKLALGPRADFALPHPAAVRKHGDSGEVDRKLRAIRKTLDGEVKMPHGDDVARSELHKTSAGAEPSTGAAAEVTSRLVSIAKADAAQKTVFGVVLDPYQVDAHNDWISPAEVERTAEGFMLNSRFISIHHMRPTEAKVVASWVEEYPSASDREKALAGEPHRIYRRKLGDDYIHSGCWVLGVKLTDELWDAFLRGEFAAYSIEGFAKKVPVTPQEMPTFTVVDLVPSHDL